MPVLATNLPDFTAVEFPYERPKIDTLPCESISFVRLSSMIISLRCLLMLEEFCSSVLESYYIGVHMARNPDDIEVRGRSSCKLFVFYYAIYDICI